MKKTKTIALLLLITAMLIPTLFSCGNNNGGTIGKEPKPFGEIYESSFSMPFNVGYTSGEEIRLPNMAVTVGYNYCFLLYKDPATNEYCVYNVDTNSTVLKIPTTKIANETEIKLYNGYIKVVETNAETKAKTTLIYNAKGTALVSADGDVAISTTDNGFTFKEKFYYVKNGEVKKEYVLPPFTRIDSSYTFTDNYVIHQKNGVVVYYNDQFEAVANYETPGYCEEYDMFLLDNDNIFVKYIQQCDPNDSQYDCMYNGCKYTLHYLIFDPVEKKETELPLKVVVYSIVNSRIQNAYDELKFEDIYTDGVENVLLYYEIVDGLPDMKTLHAVEMSNMGEIGATLDSYVENQRGVIKPLNDGYYYVPTKGGYAILDSNGTLVRNLSAIGTATDYGYRFDNNYNSSPKIYNDNFELVVDLSSGDYYALSTSYDAAVFYSKQIDGKTHYYRYDKNGEGEILPPNGREFYTSETPVRVYENYYTVRHVSANALHGESCYSVYTMNGTLLFNAKPQGNYSSPAFTLLATGDDTVLVSYIDVSTNQTVYKLLAK